MNLTYNPYYGIYISDDGAYVYDPSTGYVYQLTASGYVVIGTATLPPVAPSAPPYWPAQPPAWPDPAAPQWPWPGSPQWPWPTPAQPKPNTPTPPPPGAGPSTTGQRPPVYVVPPSPGTVVPSAAPSSSGNFVPYKTPAPAATPPAPGTPTVKQGAPPPRAKPTAPKYVPSGTGSGTGGSITSAAGPDPSAGYWEILLDTEGLWAGAPHENMFERDGSSKITKVRYPDGRLWEHKGLVVYREKSPAPGSARMYFILYDNPGPTNPFKSYWENLLAVQVMPVKPF